MARRGRPKSDRPAIDLGTPELQARRRDMVGEQGDTALSEYPLGVLLARGIITQDQHRIGCHYAWLYGKVTGRKTPAAGLVYEESGMSDDISEKEAARREELFRDYAKVLMGISRRAKDTFDNIAVYGRLPSWVRPVTWPSPSDICEATLLRQVFAVLDQRFVRGKKDVAHSARAA